MHLRMEVWLALRLDRKVGARLQKDVSLRWGRSNFQDSVKHVRHGQIDILDSSLRGCFVRRD